VNNIPVIRDTDGIFGSDCCPRPGGVKELHRVPRTPLTASVTNNEAGEVLQDEAEFPVTDEVTNDFIYDNLKA